VSRADGKLYEVLADEVCRAILRGLLSSEEPLTQRSLTAALPYNSSTISRRMADLEDLGLVLRSSGHAPYSVPFPEKTRELLVAGTDLARMTHQALAEEAARDGRELRKEQMMSQSPPGQVEELR
jgi:DNA-binding transcriptional MocR family regulator